MGENGGKSMMGISGYLYVLSSNSSRNGFSSRYMYIHLHLHDNRHPSAISSMRIRPDYLMK